MRKRKTLRMPTNVRRSDLPEFVNREGLVPPVIDCLYLVSNTSISWNSRASGGTDARRDEFDNLV